MKLCLFGEMFAEFVEDKLLSDQCSAAVQTLHSSGLQMTAERSTPDECLHAVLADKL